MRNVLLAERFHTTPLEIEDGDMDSWLTYMHVLAIESDVRELSAGLENDEPLYREDDA